MRKVYLVQKGPNAYIVCDEQGICVSGQVSYPLMSKAYAKDYCTHPGIGELQLEVKKSSTYNEDVKPHKTFLDNELK